ncbi:MAG: riboflavin synthase, partial [Bryobacteraceae bacterium]
TPSASTTSLFTPSRPTSSPSKHMFTGIIEELGTVEALETRPAGARLKVRCALVLPDMTIGASIAVNGVCLTAVDARPDSFSADLAPETLRRSNLGALRAGSRVNLERPLSPTGRLSGHIVQGHVDGTGEFLSLEALGEENWWLRVRVPAELDPYLVYKGSVAIDGISLTIAKLEGDALSVTIIPHTYRNTTLATYQPGARVNIECDILAKHVEKLLRKLDVKTGLTVEKLQEQGY